VSECMRDISTDEEVSGDENDSNLLVSNYLWIIQYLWRAWYLLPQNQVWIFLSTDPVGEISASHNGEYEDGCFLGCCTV
jgi:hypothetical protein